MCAYAVVAKVVPYKGAEIADDANIRGRWEGRFAVRVVVQLFGHAQNIISSIALFMRMTFLKFSQKCLIFKDDQISSFFIFFSVLHIYFLFLAFSFFYLFIYEFSISVVLDICTSFPAGVQLFWQGFLGFLVFRGTLTLIVWAKEKIIEPAGCKGQLVPGVGLGLGLTKTI